MIVAGIGAIQLDLIKDYYDQFYKESKKEILSVILSCLGLFLLKGFLVARAQIITFSIFILKEKLFE